MVEKRCSNCMNFSSQTRKECSHNNENKCLNGESYNTFEYNFWKPIPEYPKYMICISDDIIVVNFECIGTGTVIYCSDKNNYVFGDRHDYWAMNFFRNLTDEEYNKFIKKENKMKYKLLRDINGESLYKDGACITEFEKYLEKYGFHKRVIWDKINEDYMINQNGWIKFLLDHKYIELNKPKLVYDESKIYILKTGADIYKLHIIDHNDNMFAFINLNNNITWANDEHDSGQAALDYCIKYNGEIYAFDNIFNAVEFCKR